MDPAIIAALQYPMPPAMPLTFEERMWQSPVATELERRSKRTIDSYAHYVANWFREIDAIRNPLLQATVPQLTPNEEIADRLAALAIEVEQAAEERAISLNRLQKRFGRLSKRAFVHDASVGALVRSTGNAIAELEQSVIERLLDFALWVRGIRSIANPAARGGETFSDQASLEKFLERETA
jgi:hypothetical protein